MAGPHAPFPSNILQHRIGAAPKALDHGPQGHGCSLKHVIMPKHLMRPASGGEHASSLSHGTLKYATMTMADQVWQRGGIIGGHADGAQLVGKPMTLPMQRRLMRLHSLWTDICPILLSLPSPS